MSNDRLHRALDCLDDLDPVTVRGRVTAVTGTVLRARMPGIRTGDHLRILRSPDRDTSRGPAPLEAEVVGFRDDEAILMPLGEAEGIGPDSLVEPIARSLTIRCGPGLLGRVLDGLGQPIDGGPALTAASFVDWPVQRSAPPPLSRPRILRPLALGLRVIDGLLSVGEGQRVGLFAGSGVGKSTMLGQIARNTDADVCVVCLLGERGREVREFIEESLGDGLARSVVVCATSDTAPLVRLKSAQVATAIAEYFRESGKRVLLLLDSITRYARALREVGLAAGEPPVRRGYPPSVFGALPRLLERTGTSPQGSITAIYTVLVEGGDMEEPIADEVRSILDGHVVLSRQLAQRNHWPAVDVLQSVSRVMGAVVDKPHLAAARAAREVLATYESKRDLITLGAYSAGSDPKVDYALGKIRQIESFLQQGVDETNHAAQTRSRLLGLFDEDPLK